MKRGFLLHDRNKHIIAVSQRDASTTPPSPEFAMAAETVTVILRFLHTQQRIVAGSDSPTPIACHKMTESYCAQ